MGPPMAGGPTASCHAASTALVAGTGGTGEGCTRGGYTPVPDLGLRPRSGTGLGLDLVSTSSRLGQTQSIPVPSELKSQITSK